MWVLQNNAGGWVGGLTGGLIASIPPTFSEQVCPSDRNLPCDQLLTIIDYQKQHINETWKSLNFCNRILMNDWFKAYSVCVT